MTDRTHPDSGEILDPGIVPELQATIKQLRAELRDSNERIAYLQNELRSYKEREKVWGWNHD